MSAPVDELRRVLEERAERGSPRGFDEIVATAERRTPSAPPTDHEHNSPRRLALVAVAALVVILAATAVWLSRGSTRNEGRIATTPTVPTTPATLSADWVATSPSGIAGRFAAATATDGRRMFVFGGLNTSGTTSFTDGALFDPGSNTWEPVPDAPAGFGGPDAVAVWDGQRFLVLAPADTDAPVRLAAYDPQGKVWQELAAPPIGPRDGLLALWTGTALIAGGGGAGDGIPLPFGAIYDPTTNAWEVLPEPPFPHYVPAAVVWDGSAAVFIGGVASNEGTSAVPQRQVPGARFTPGSPGAWVSTVPAGPLASPQWASVTPNGISVLGTNGQSQVETATLDQLNNGWIGRRTRDTPGVAFRAVPAGQQGGWVAVTKGGGVVFNGDEIRMLPATDLADRVTASIVAVGNSLIIWGGLHDTSEQDAALDTGLFIRLDDVIAPTTTSGPEAQPQPPPDEIALDLDGDGRYDDLRVASEGSNSTLRLTLATGRTSELAFTTCGTRLLGVGRLNGQPLIFYNECGATIVNAQLATVVDGVLTRVTLDNADGATDVIAWNAHSNCCPFATVDVVCAATDGHDTLLRTGSRLVHKDGTEVTDPTEVDDTKSPAELATQFDRAWTKATYRLNGARLELVRTEAGTIVFDGSEPAGVPLRNRLQCGEVTEPN